MQSVAKKSNETTSSDLGKHKNKPKSEEAVVQREINPLWHSMATNMGGHGLDSPNDPPSVQTKSLHSQFIQRMCTECEEEFPQESSTIQTKLTVGAPNDEYEQEADAVADQVMRMPAGSGGLDELQDDSPQIQTKLLNRPTMQRMCTGCEEELGNGDSPSVQTKSNGTTSQLPAPNSVLNTINSPGSGLPLNETVRSRVEPVLAADLSGVRVHSGIAAQHASQSLNAKAFTNENHIFLGANQSADDLDLMAHEATHTVQQKGGEKKTLQRVGEDYSAETYSQFTERVKARGMTRLTRNIGILAQWRRYIERMEDFQLQAQLLAGIAREYSQTAVGVPHLQDDYETWAGSHNEAERNYAGSQLDIDSNYRERSNNFIGLLGSRAFGYSSSPSVAERTQVLVGDRSESDLPIREWVAADPRYNAYKGPLERFHSGENGACQTCHDINAAWQSTAERWGSPMPEGPIFPDFSNYTSLLNQDTMTEPVAGQLSPSENAMIQSWLNNDEPMQPPVAVDDSRVAMNNGVMAASDLETEASPTANSFIPEIPIPEPVEVPPPRSDLCGELSAADESNSSAQFDSAAWGPNSAIMFSVVNRIGAILTPLGPRGYRVLGRQTFDQLWAVGPEGDDLEDVRRQIVSEIDSKRESYVELRARIGAGSVPYLDLCPIVDELLPSTNILVRTQVLEEIYTQRAIEFIVEALDWVLLALAFIYPPSIIITMPLRAGLALAKIGVGASQVRRGSDFQRGVGSGVFSSEQEASAESLQSRGRMNMLAGALDLMFMGVGRLTARKPPSVFEDELVLRGWRSSRLPNGTMWTHPDYAGSIWREGNVFEFADGSMNTVGRLEFVGSRTTFNPVSVGQSGVGRAASGFGDMGTTITPYGSGAMVPWTGGPYNMTMPPASPLLPGPIPGGSLLRPGTAVSSLENQLVASGQFEGRTGLVDEPYLPQEPGESLTQHRERMLDAIDERFDDVLYEEYQLAMRESRVASGEDWVGFQFNRQDRLGTRFDPENRMIVFTMDRSLNRFTVAEEVQHALDYTLGAQSTRQMSERGMQALAGSTGRSLEQVRTNLTSSEVDWINDWWHRRVFTRLIKNIHKGNYGLEYLQPRIQEVHELYQEIGGTLTLDEIFSTTWTGVF